MPGSIVPLPVMLEEEQAQRDTPPEQPKSIVVRLGKQRLIAELPYELEQRPGCGTKLVVRTDRGMELAEVLTTTCSNGGCGKSITRKQMLDYIQNSGGRDYPFFAKGKVLHIAGADDLTEQRRIDSRKPEAMKICRGLIDELNLEMRLVDVEFLLGGERIIFYYTAENWVDFRELVRQLASEFQTRIEMQQINDREEARLVADYEKCGQHCCCRQFLKVLKPVSMRSAKVQKATLDPQKISGRCGRLMCCLRYEDKTYSDLKKNLPHRKTIVETPDGPGIVLDTQILTQLALVRLGDNPPTAYPIEDISPLDKQAAAQWRQDEQDRKRQRQEQADARQARRDRRRGGSSSQSSGGQTSQQPPQSSQNGDNQGQEQSQGQQDDTGSPSRGYSNRNQVTSGDQAPAADGNNIHNKAGSGEQSQDGQGRKRKRRRRRRRRGGKGKGGGQSGSDGH